MPTSVISVLPLRPKMNGTCPCVMPATATRTGAVLVVCAKTVLNDTAAKSNGRMSRVVAVKRMINCLMKRCWKSERNLFQHYSTGDNRYGVLKNLNRYMLTRWSTELFYCLPSSKAAFHPAVQGLLKSFHFQQRLLSCCSGLSFSHFYLAGIRQLPFCYWGCMPGYKIVLPPGLFQ